MFRKFLATSLLSAFLLTNVQIVSAFDYLDNDVEHLQAVENSKINLVKVTPCGNIIQKENYIVVNFAQNFNSKYYKTGDYVQFSFDQDLKTQEGTLFRSRAQT